MAIPSMVTKVTLAVLGAGVVGAGIAIPFSQNQNKNSSSTIASPEPTPTKNSSKPLDKETFRRFSGDEQKIDCYSFASVESNSSPLLLFCSDEDSNEKSNTTFKFWDGEELKVAVNLIKESNSNLLVAFGSGGSFSGEINIDDYDLVGEDWSFINLSSCKIESQTLNRRDTNKSLVCTYYPDANNEEVEGEEVTKPVFLLEKFDFPQQKEKVN